MRKRHRRDSSRSSRVPAMTRYALVLAGVVIAMTLSSAVALADHQRAEVSVSARAGAKLEEGYVLDARLVTADGKPVNDVTVRFYELVELIGPRRMLIAAAKTDGQGRAAVTYLPARTGSHRIVVAFDGRDHLGPAGGATTFDAAVAAPPYRPEHAPLFAFSAAVPYAVGVLVLAVWSVIAFALFSTARGVIGGARNSE